MQLQFRYTNMQYENFPMVLYSPESQNQHLYQLNLLQQTTTTQGFVKYTTTNVLFFTYLAAGSNTLTEGEQ